MERADDDCNCRQMPLGSKVILICVTENICLLRKPDYSTRHSRTIWPMPAADSDQEPTGITTTCRLVDLYMDQDHYRSSVTAAIQRVHYWPGWTRGAEVEIARVHGGEEASVKEKRNPAEPLPSRGACILSCRCVCRCVHAENGSHSVWCCQLPPCWSRW